MTKHFVNLLQPALFPKQPLWTLTRVVALWGVTFFLMILWIFISQNQANNLAEQQRKLNTENSQYKSDMVMLEAKIKAHQPTQSLVDKLDDLKIQIKNKQYLHQKLTDESRTYVSGFSTAMTELSLMHHRDLSLQNVFIDHDDMTFTGVARTPEVVPAWLAGFEKSTFLSGKAFINFTLQENEQQLTEFVVSSKVTISENN